MRLTVQLVICCLAFIFSCGCVTIPSNPSITSSIAFTTAHLTGPVSKAQLATLWNAKLKIGSGDPDDYEFLTSTNGQNQRLRVETCQQYTNAIQQGAYSLTTADMATEVWFKRAAGTLKFMATAQACTQLLPDAFLSQLPVSLVGWNGSDEEAQINQDTIKGITLKDYARSGRVTKFKPGNHTLNFQTGARDFALEELARGDWNGDGTEDALISVTWHYNRGSGFGYALYAVTRSTNGPNLLLNPVSLR